MSYQQSSNEQPYPQQQPPVMNPQGGGSIDFQAILKSQGNRPLVIAGAGALLTLIGYLAFPIYSASGGGLSVSAKAGDLGGSQLGTGIGGIYGLTWLVLIASIVGVIVVGLMLFAPKTVAQLTPRMGAMILTGCGAICVLWTVLDFFKLNGLYSGSNKITGFSAGVDWGMYALIITSIVLLVGGVMQLQRSPKVM